MKKTILAISLMAASSAATAKDECFTYDNGDPAALTLYKVEVVKAKPNSAERLSGVAVMPNVLMRGPMFVEGSVLRLDNGHVNLYMVAIGYDGKAVSEPVYVLFANRPNYAGTESPNLYHVSCEGFPVLENGGVIAM